MKAKTGPSQVYRRSATLAQAMAKQQEASAPSMTTQRREKAASFHGAGPINFQTSPPPSPDPSRLQSAMTGLGGSAGGSAPPGAGGSSVRGNSPPRGRFATAAPARGAPGSAGDKVAAKTSPARGAYDATWSSGESTAVPSSPFSPARASALARQIRPSSTGALQRRVTVSLPGQEAASPPGRALGLKAATQPVVRSARAPAEVRDRSATEAQGRTMTARTSGAKAAPYRKTTLQSSQSEKSLGSVQSGGSKGRQPFGTGDRMDPGEWKQWSNMVDKQALGAHYNYIVGELGAGYHEMDQDVRDYDDLCHDGLHRKRPDDTSHPRAADPRPPAAAAFADRALRMREGKGARTAMRPPVEEAEPVQYADHGSCNCPVCNPHSSLPAGQPSHLVHTNRANRCGKDHHVDFQASHTFQSLSMGSTLKHPEGGPEVPPEFEEATFVRSMGRKAKHPEPSAPGGGRMMMHRSLSLDALPAAGDHNRELASEITTLRNRRRQDWQQSRSGSLPPQRHGAALAIHPSDDDPPAPTRIAACIRGAGTFKDGFSSEVERTAMLFNQENFRFADSQVVRGRSQPPPRRPTSMAGTSTGLLGNHNWGQANPLTMEGKESITTALGGSCASFRKNLGNTSHGVAFMTNHDVCNESFAMETDYRMRTEPAFAALCAATHSHNEWSRTAHSLRKEANGHESTAVRSHLQWPEE